MLKDGALGDSERNGDITDPGRVITMLGKMLGRGLDDAAPFDLRARPGWGLTLIVRWGDAIAGDSGHRMTISHDRIQGSFGDFNFNFAAICDSVIRFRNSLRDFQSIHTKRCHGRFTTPL